MKRRYFFIALIVFLAAAGSFSRMPPAGSTFVPDNRGTQAAFALFERLGAEPRRHLLPFNQLPLDSAGYTLFVIAPEEIGGAADLSNWLARGNRLVLFDNPAADTRALLEKLGIAHPEVMSGQFEMPKLGDDYSPVQDPAGDLTARSALAGVSEISTPRGFPVIPASDQTAVVSDEKLAYAVHFASGGGDVWYFSGPEPILNRSIDLYDNMRLMLQLVRDPKLLLIDEFHHGFRQPVAAEMQQRWDLLLFLLGSIALVILLGFLSRAVRFGPPSRSLTSRIASTTEFITALGLLYSSHRANSVLAGYATAWKRRVGRQSAVNPDLPAAQFAENLSRAGLVTLPESARLRSILERLGESADGALPRREIETEIAYIEELAARRAPGTSEREHK